MPISRQQLAGIAPSNPVEVGRPNLTTPRMVLRPLIESDRDSFLRATRLSRAHLDRFAAIHRPDETDEGLFERQLRLTQEGLRTDQALRLVGIAPDGRITGAFNFNSITRGLEFAADLNWWVSAEFLGSGYATEGVGALVRHGLADPPGGLGVHELRAWIREDNPASIHIARKLGFRRAEAERSYLQTGFDWKLHELYICRA